MQLKIKIKYLKELKEVHPSEVVKKAIGYSSDEEFEHVTAEKLSREQLDWLYDRARSTKDASTGRYEEGAVGLSDKIATYRKVLDNPSGHKFSSLETLETALYQYILPSPHKWLFHEEEDGQMVPYFVKDVKYKTSDGYSPPETLILMVSLYRGKPDERRLSFDADDLRGGATVTELLSGSGYVLEQPEMVERYEEEVERYLSLRDQTGAQFRADGLAFPHSSSYGRVIAMTRDGLPSRVVMDDVVAEETDDRYGSTTKDGRATEKASTIATTLWTQGPKGGKKHSRSDDDESDVYTLPVQPYVAVFDLQKHNFVDIHVNGLKKYEYDKSLIGKLILPENTKDLILILMQSAGSVMDDIIAGKTGGIIVLATGEPGVGKTLSAEVASEELEKPLYVVQCSQLGTDEVALEKKLTRVLQRATRWGAILLIDEADVYIHERGEDIQQNAIVGVFLRVLEYYRGILFMTSNRQTIIDDAIMSRVTAWVQYPLPGERIREIWRVLSVQFQISLSERDIDEMAGMFPTITGRNVKSLLKLSKLLADARREEVTPALVRYVSQFQKLAGVESELGRIAAAFPSEEEKI